MALTTVSLSLPSTSSAGLIPRRPPPQSPARLPCITSQQPFVSRSRRSFSHIVRMAPDEQRMTRRSPLDFPLEWERPNAGRRPEILPQFSPMKTPLPPPLPSDPPMPDEVEETDPEEEEQEDYEDEEEEEPEE